MEGRSLCYILVVGSTVFTPNTTKWWQPVIRRRTSMIKLRTNTSAWQFCLLLLSHCLNNTLNITSHGTLSLIPLLNDIRHAQFLHMHKIVSDYDYKIYNIFSAIASKNPNNHRKTKVTSIWIYNAFRKRWQYICDHNCGKTPPNIPESYTEIRAVE